MHRAERRRRRLERRLARLKRRLRRPVSPAAAVSPLAPRDGFPALPEISGLRLATAAAALRYRGRDDVMLAVLDPGTVLAGVTTRSATRSASVLDCEAKLRSPGDPAAGAAILVNAGNANAFTGAGGDRSVARLVSALGARLDLPPGRIFTSSTGVIGEPLPDDRITARLDALAQGLRPDGLTAAARAIMTTDTFPKGAGRTVEIGGAAVRIAGIAKGSGMIAPDMATMLAYVFTDARIARPLLQSMLTELAGTTFNCITVDGDTSTSDTLLVAATGQSGPVLEPAHPDLPAFRAAMETVMRDLAQQVVRDGEGARKFVEIRVTGAADNREARLVAQAVANSPLVKTAIAGEDPNWGRIVMAVGKAGARAERDRLTIRIGGVLVACDGWVAPDYCEAAGVAAMRAEEIPIAVDLGLGDGAATVWTCDLTAGYIAINADYRS